MSIKQKTIKKECSISGIGLHTGCKSTAVFKPAAINSGIVIVRVDLPGSPFIKVDVSNIQIDEHSRRCTSLKNGNAVVYTIEHLMSVLCGLGISNLLIELNADEIPGMDGSGLEFWRLFQAAGIEEQDADVKIFEIKEPIAVHKNGSSIVIYPSEKSSISYVLDYDNDQLRSQLVEVDLDQDVFEKEIVSCRTFCLEAEAESLKKAGLGLGANYKNTLVVGENGVKDNKVRFTDEFARHKILDLIGDLYLLGVPIKGHIFAIKSGHELNIRLLKEISKQKTKYESKSTVSTIDISGIQDIRIDAIMKILPHRYPFLLVDRVVIEEKGKKAVGIKNVTINEQFFQGHFPDRPVMPGVLMLEAMAQTAGVMILTGREQQNELALFMALDDVKFRKVVSPGDQVHMFVEVVKDRSRIAQVKGVAKVEDKVVAEATMTFALANSFL
jgi:UDP-3-O-[3-hydroxymyristoyl] N-acetylglucosamine deacetylase/3-hydroxyacyl-[acyl-carrier-protein] dehydratase